MLIHFARHGQIQTWGVFGPALARDFETLASYSTLSSTPFLGRGDHRMSPTIRNNGVRLQIQSINFKPNIRSPQIGSDSRGDLKQRKLACHSDRDNAVARREGA